MASIHKYDVIVNYVEECIKNGTFTLYSKIPSIKSLQTKFSLSRCSVFQAMENLKNRGIIESEPAVGYYVSNTDIRTKKRVMLIFGRMNPFKEELYDAIMSHLDKGVEVDMSFHYLERSRLEDLISLSSSRYNTLVVIPGPFPGLGEVLDKCKGNVILLDYFNRDLIGKYSSIGQDFVMDTYNAFVGLLPKIRKYKKIVLVQKSEMEPNDRNVGMKHFCEQYGFTYQLITDLSNLIISPLTLYVVPNDNELVSMIRKVRHSELKMGKDYGLISFNECPLKEVLEGGITTITTDFRKMGETAAEMINQSDGRIQTVPNPWNLLIRDSI